MVSLVMESVEHPFIGVQRRSQVNAIIDIMRVKSELMRI